MTDYNSHKIRLFSSFLILMVVYLHSYYLEGEKYLISWYIMTFVGGGICGVANYMFFIISGYLFFLNVRGMKDIKMKMKKRIRSLLLPYLLWNVLFVLWYVGLSLFPLLSEQFVNGSIIDNLNSATLLGKLYMVFIKPAAFHLWFLRDLMVLVLFSPLIWLLLKRWRWVVLSLLFLGSLFVAQIGLVAMFVIGGYIAIYNINIGELTERCRQWLPIFAVVFVGAAVFYPYHLSYVRPFLSLLFLCGIITLWCLYDLLRIDRLKWFEPLLGYSFFIYCFHMPFFNIIKKINLMVMGESLWSILLLYFINPIIAVAIIILIAKLLQKISLKGYLVLTGNRK